MLDVLFDVAILTMTGMLVVMPFISILATIYLYKLWKNSDPRNRVLRTATITSAMVTLGGMWWSFVAVRRVLVGPDGAALPEWAIIFYGISLILIMITPLVKVIELLRISHSKPTQAQLDNLRRLESEIADSVNGTVETQEQQNLREDIRFGTDRRALEVEHNERRDQIELDNLN
jgi:uncharacterized membrane protein